MAKKKNLVERIFEEFPEEKKRYEQMNSYNKFFYRVGLYVLNTRKEIKDSQPEWYKNMWFTR